MTSLYNKYRPTKLSELVGQDEAVGVLSRLLRDKNLPHCLLFTGPSGTGKTTTARILAAEVGCVGSGISEINCALVDPMDTVREIDRASNYKSLDGGNRAWVIDELQSFTRATHSMDALLKIFEDAPAHAYFFVCTTDPQKIKPTVRNRCTEVRFVAVARDQLARLVDRTWLAEGGRPDKKVVEHIAELADGSPRKALVMLEKVIRLETPVQQMQYLERGDTDATKIQLFKQLLNPKVSFKSVAQTLKGLEGEEPEQVRRMVLACARNAMLERSDPFAYLIVKVFQYNFFDSGAAGLAAACWEVKNIKHA